ASAAGCSTGTLGAEALPLPSGAATGGGSAGRRQARADRSMRRPGSRPGFSGPSILVSGSLIPAPPRWRVRPCSCADARAGKMLEQRSEEALTIQRRPGELLDRVLGVGHEADDVAGLVAYAGD